MMFGPVMLSYCCASPTPVSRTCRMTAENRYVILVLHLPYLLKMKDNVRHKKGEGTLHSSPALKQGRVSSSSYSLQILVPLTEDEHAKDQDGWGRSFQAVEQGCPEEIW